MFLSVLIYDSLTICTPYSQPVFLVGVIVEGDTSTFECAHELGKLTENRSVVVNVIPYNQTDVKDKLRCPNEQHIKEFQRIVASYGTFCTIRRTMGADIDSACGQLIVLDKKEKDQGSPQLSPRTLADIEDGPMGSSNGSGVARSGISVVMKRPSQSVDTATEKGEKVHQEASTPSRSVDGSGRTSINKECPDDDGLDLESLVRPLQIATTAAASFFVMSALLYLRQQKKK